MTGDLCEDLCVLHLVEYKRCLYYENGKKVMEARWRGEPVILKSKLENFSSYEPLGILDYQVFISAFWILTVKANKSLVVVVVVVVSWATLAEQEAAEQLSPLEVVFYATMEVGHLMVEPWRGTDVYVTCSLHLGPGEERSGPDGRRRGARRRRSQQLPGQTVGEEAEAPGEGLLQGRAGLPVGPAAAGGVHLLQVPTHTHTLGVLTPSDLVVVPGRSPGFCRTSVSMWPKFWVPVVISMRWSTCQLDTPGTRTSSLWRRWLSLDRTDPGPWAGGPPERWCIASR